MFQPAVKYTLLVPVFMPDGDTPTDPAVLTFARDSMTARFGGVTVEPLPANGSYRMAGGEIVTEPMHEVWTLATEPDPAHHDERFLDRLAAEIAAECEQEAVLVFAEEARVSFVKPREPVLR